MKRIPNASLTQLNSFCIAAQAKELICLETREDLEWLASGFQYDRAQDLVLGEGSNVLFAGNIDGTVILNRICGKKIIEQSADTSLLEVNAGENWHQLVLWSLEQGLSGIENLSLIPGSAGAAPIQNIGAYGVELAEVLESVDVLELDSGQQRTFSQAECAFSYRQSRFKSTDAGRYLVTRIRLRLRRSFQARLDYAGLAQELRAMGIEEPDAKQVSNAVINIRRRKLPDPGVTGNAGSFFKNPQTDRQTAEELQKRFPGLPVFEAGDDHVKLSAAWMIEHCDWRGQRVGHAAVSHQHALVLVNLGKAKGAEILELAEKIGRSVWQRFGIRLEPEVRIIY
jgi:UDP-N-acetylmuramate dehydrogenase